MMSEKSDLPFSNSSLMEGPLLAPGSIVARKYVVLQFLGKGAAGTVYLCHDLNDRNDLRAIKILSGKQDDPDFYVRFYREGKAAQAICSPFVVRSFDLIADDGVFAYTMEYVHGGSLDDLLKVTPKPALPIVYCALWEICQGLIEIHRERLVHRDLKPSNILLTESLHFKITDLGIVQRTPMTEVFLESEASPNTLLSLWKDHGTTITDASITRHGTILGTIDYLSPEYVRYTKIDHRADIYSLGTMAFRMLAGRLPFSQGTVLDRLRSRIDRVAPELITLRHDIPKPINDLVASALSREPEERPQSAVEFADKLFSYLKDCEWFQYYKDQSPPERSAQM